MAIAEFFGWEPPALAAIYQRSAVALARK